MAPEPTHLAWIDLETTGTNERRDAIIEVGFILTDMDLRTEDEMSWVVLPDAPNEVVVSWMNDTVKEMHRANGLLMALANGEGYPLHIVETRLLDMLDVHGVQSHAIMLAGSGVGHFDKRFVEAQMPAFYKKMAYPVIDVGVLRRFIRDVVGAPDLIPQDGNSATKTHRAFDDVRQHLSEALHYKGVFNVLVERAS